MGCGGSSLKFTENSKLKGQGSDVRVTQRQLQYTDDDIDQLYSVFRKYDTKNSGMIYISDIAMSTEAETVAFIELIFRIFDRDDSRGYAGILNFNEFITACWHILTVTNTDQIAILIFDLFDLNKINRLTVDEMKFIYHLLDNFKSSKPVLEFCHDLDRDKLAEENHELVGVVEKSGFLDVLKADHKCFLMQLFIQYKSHCTGETKHKKLKPILDLKSWERLVRSRQRLHGDKTISQALAGSIDNMKILSHLATVMKAIRFQVNPKVAGKFFPDQKLKGIHNEEIIKKEYQESGAHNRHITHSTSVLGHEDAERFKDKIMNQSIEHEAKLHGGMKKNEDSPSGKRRTRDKGKKGKVHAEDED